MVITNKTDLPSFESLEVEEINLSHVTLLAAGPYLGKKCEAVNNEFMLCRHETMDARACMDLGKAVTSCSLGFFRELKSNCKSQFDQYANCIDKSSGDGSFKFCRKTQATLDECMEEKMKMQRPDFGYFCRARVHSTSRPKPPTEDPVCPSLPPCLPDSKPRPPARFQSRFYWMNE